MRYSSACKSSILAGSMRRFRHFVLPACWVVALALAGCDTAAPDEECEEGGCYSLPFEHVQPIDVYPAWGPDGETIAYTHWPQNEEERALGGQQIWTLDLGTRERRFLAEGRHPTWRPDGREIAYVGPGNNIYVVNVETSQTRRLTEWGACFYPTWSPDGEWIAFDTNHGDEAGANVIWKMRRDGSEKTDISEHGVGEWRAPTWSRGDWIVHLRAFLKESESALELFRMRPDGTDAQRLTTNDLQERSPEVSSDGTRIAWHGYTGSDPGGIWIMDGVDQRRLRGTGGYVSFSPDGRRLAFHDTLRERYQVLWTMNADGTGAAPLTFPEDYTEG